MWRCRSLTARGCSDEEIARTLFVSRRTIAARVSGMLRRVVATNRAEPVARAFVAGLPVPTGWPAEPREPAEPADKRCPTVPHAALAG